MKNTINEYKRLLTTLDTTTGVRQIIEMPDEKRLEMSMDLLRQPGLMNLDHRIFNSRLYSKVFDENGTYCDFLEGTLDYNKFWEDAKLFVHSGLLIDDTYYLTGDALWYLNFIQIPDKVNKTQAFPMILDTDIWYYQHIQLAVLQNKFTYTLKKRQIGVTLKLVAKILKRFWFESMAKCKLAVWDEKYQTANWDILTNYKDFLNEHTGWYRDLTPGKVFHWVQATELNDARKTKKGLKSELKSVNTKTNPASVVSGGVTEAFIDEAGVNPNLNETVGFLEPALFFGQEMTGEVHIAGAVGNMDQSKPLKNAFYKPGSKGYPIFIPEEYSYFPYIDEYGNSKLEESIEIIEAEYKRLQKEVTLEAFVLYRSQHPRTPEHCFNETKDNPFNESIIRPHYEWLMNNYNPVIVTLDNDGWYYFGSKHSLIVDYPHNPILDNTGVVIIDEPPIMKNPPFGLYYGSTDPIRPIRVKGIASLQATYIYKSAHEINGEFTQDKLVAWYAGRADDPYKTFDISRKLVKLYNARHAVENDQAVFIEWLIGEGETKYLMKRSEMPILTDWVPKSTISSEEYGWRTGSGQSVVKQRLLELAVLYTEEQVGVRFDEDGNAHPIYGVERIKDVMLLKEMLEYGDNTDRIIAFAGGLMAAKGNTNRGFKVRTINEDNKRVVQEALQRPNLRFNSLHSNKKKWRK